MGDFVWFPNIYNDKTLINNDRIYISSEDSGSILIYDFSGNLLFSIKFGEHISDFIISDNFMYVITYQDNFLIKSTLSETINKIPLNDFPQRILYKKFLYVLLNNEYFSYIKLFDSDLNFIKEIKFERQIGDLYCFQNKLIFNGEDYNYILSENLTLISQKNSTGKILCKFSDYPIFESGERLDIINNIIYPS